MKYPSTDHLSLPLNISVAVEDSDQNSSLAAGVGGNQFQKRELDMKDSSGYFLFFEKFLETESVALEIWKCEFIEAT